VHPGSIPDNRAIDAASDGLREQHPKKKKHLGSGQGDAPSQKSKVAGLELEGNTRKLVLSVPNDEFKEEVDPGPGKEKLRVIRREGKGVPQR
jgi:hypothetical protein